MSHENGENPRSPLEVIGQIIRPTERDPLLSETNLGLGNYTDGMFWQQVEDFRKHLYGEAAFGNGKNLDRAVADVCYELAAEEWGRMTDAAREQALADMGDDLGRERPVSRREWFKRTGERLFDDRVEPDAEEYGGALKPEEREYLRMSGLLELVGERTHVSGELRTVMARMLTMKHEGSRGRGAHLIDSATGRTKEYKFEGEKPPKRSRRGRR